MDPDAWAEVEMRFGTVWVSWKTREERAAKLMFAAPGSLKYLLYGLAAFVLVLLVCKLFIDQTPRGEYRLLLGLPVILGMFGPLFYASLRAERHTWDVLERDCDGIPIFYSFGRGDTMLLGTRQGWIGYGCLKTREHNQFTISSKYELEFDLSASCVSFGSFQINNRKEQAACNTSEDGRQLYLWQPNRDISKVLKPLLLERAETHSAIKGIPDIQTWPVLGPTRFTARGLWPTLAIVGLLQVGIVYLAKLVQMPGIEWLPIGLTVAPMIYLLFEGAGRQRTMLFGEFLERQVVAHDPERLA